MAFPEPVNAADRAKFYGYVDEHVESYIERLKEAVAIPSVSADGARREDCIAMVHYYKERMDKLGVTTELRPLGKQTGHPMGLDLPPVILGWVQHSSFMPPNLHILSQ